MNEERIEELEAMMVYLLRRIEEAEKKKRTAPSSSYLKELKKEAQKILKNWI